jgi:hypothetical protein
MLDLYPLRFDGPDLTNVRRMGRGVAITQPGVEPRWEDPDAVGGETYRQTFVGPSALQLVPLAVAAAEKELSIHKALCVARILNRTPPGGAPVLVVEWWTSVAERDRPVAEAVCVAVGAELCGRVSGLVHSWKRHPRK